MRRRSGNKRDFWKDTNQRRMSLCKSSASWFRRWQWQWSATLTIPREFKTEIERANAAVKDWIRRLCIGEGIQVGSYFTVCRKGKDDGVHIHLLMIGEGRRNGQLKSLMDVDVARWKREWPFISKIETVESQARATKYLGAQFLKNVECDVGLFNKNLLKRKEIIPDLGPRIGVPTEDEV